jgi:hypothetical protein
VSPIIACARRYAFGVLLLQVTFISLIFVSTVYLATCLQMHWSLTLPVSIVAFSLLSYLLALLNLLEFLDLFIYFVFILLMMTICLQFLKKRFVFYFRLKCRIQAVLELIGLALPFLVFFAAIDRNWKFVVWDELSGWGPGIWTIFEEQRIWNSGDFLANKTYPPLQQISQFVFLDVFGWDESLVLISNNFVMLLLLLTIASGLRRFNQKALLPFFYVSIGIFYLFGFNFKTILADSLLALYFAAGVVLAITLPFTKSFFPIIALFSSATALVKPTGIFFGVLIGVLGLIRHANEINVGQDTAKKYLRGKKRTISVPVTWNSTKGLRLNLIDLKNLQLQSVVHLLPPLFSWLTWQLYMTFSHIPRSLIGDPNFSKVFTPEGINRLKETLFAFGRTLTQPLPEVAIGSLGVLTSPLALTLFLYLYHLHLNKSSLRQSKFELNEATLVLIFWLMYQFLLIFSYFYFFTEYEGVRVASMTRYEIGFYYAWTLLLLFKTYLKYQSKFSHVLQIALAVSLVLSSNPLMTDLREIKPDANNVEIRNSMEKRVNLVKEKITTKDKIYIIDQNSTGYAKNLFYYLMLPNHTNYWCWTVGKKYYEGDVWTCPQDLSSLLRDYDYLYIHNADEQFWRKLSLDLGLDMEVPNEYFFKLTHRADKITLDGVKFN